MNNDTPETITIQLTQGQVTIIDAKHKDLAEFHWHVTKDKKNNKSWYAKQSLGKNAKKSLSRIILERKIDRPLAKDEIADHINGDTLDNRESNLRLASKSENNRNRKIRKDNTSGYKGVYKHRSKWKAQIGINGKKVYLGAFDTPEKAYKAYCEAAIKHYREFARL